MTPAALRAGTRREVRALGAKHGPRTLPAATLPHAALVEHTRFWRDVSRAMDAAVAAELRTVGLRLDAAGDGDGGGPMIPGPDRVKVIRALRARLYRLAGRRSLAGELDAIARRVESMSERQWTAALRRFGVTPAQVAMDTHVARFRSQNLALIKSLAVDKVARVRAVLTEAGVGARPREIARRIREETDATESRAALIARDQTLKLFGQMTQARHEAAGITQYTWSTVRDRRVRPGHAALEGTRQRYDAPPIVDPKSGRRAHPSGDYQCRCAALPVLPTE